jgi:hypothetical protein
MFGDGDASRYFARVSLKTWNLETSGISPQIANKAIAVAGPMMQKLVN